MATINTLDVTGHTTLEYDPTVEADLANAREVFDELMGQGFVAAADLGGGRELVRDFPATAEEITVFPALRGG